MKNIIYSFIIIFIISCKNQETKTEVTVPENLSPIALGKQIFEGKGNCIACHLVNQKVVGPSIQQMAKIYKSKNGNIINFLKYDAVPIIDRKSVV